MGDMDIHELISDIEAFSARTGMRADLVCRKATGNPYLLDRLHKRVRQTEIDAERIHKFIATYVPKDGDKCDECQLSESASAEKNPASQIQQSVSGGEQ